MLGWILDQSSSAACASSSSSMGVRWMGSIVSKSPPSKSPPPPPEEPPRPPLGPDSEDPRRDYRRRVFVRLPTQIEATKTATITYPM